MTLSLDDPRWADLEQAFGSARDVPRLLAALATLDAERDRAEIWFALWRMLCHEGEVYPASYAAAPHVVAIAERLPLRERAQALQLVASIEGYRAGGVAPPIDSVLAASYGAAVAALGDLVCGSRDEPWDADVARVMASVLLVSRGQAEMGMALMEGRGS